MPPTYAEAGDATPLPQWFVATHWSVILSAKDGDSGAAATALDKLCRTYWWPLYMFVRRQGHGVHDAQDLTQEFIYRLLAKDFLTNVDRAKGKFRSYLMGAMQHFLAKEWRRSNAQKRGGQHQFLPMDTEAAEEQYLQIPAAGQTPEQAYNYQCAIKLFERVLDRLREEEVAKGHQLQFEALKVWLCGERPGGFYAELAAKLGTTVDALKTAVSRMRRRYGELLREEIAHTVSTPEEVEEELRALAAILRA